MGACSSHVSSSFVSHAVPRTLGLGYAHTVAPYPHFGSCSAATFSQLCVALLGAGRSVASCILACRRISLVVLDHRLILAQECLNQCGDLFVRFLLNFFLSLQAGNDGLHFGAPLLPVLDRSLEPFLPFLQLASAI